MLVIDGLLGFGTVLYMIALLGFIMPNCAVLARRLHDTNKTGWWTLIMAVPFGGLVLLIFILQPSDKFTNRYG